MTSPASPPTLADYLYETRDLLHDSNDLLWPTQKIGYINRALQRRDLDLYPNRTQVAFNFTAGQALYTLNVLGVPRAFDVIGITVTYGNLQVPLRGMDFTTLVMRYQRWTTLTYFPRAYCRYGIGGAVPSIQVQVAPIPSSNYPSVWDVASFSAPLVNLADVDPVHYPYSLPVPYYAAYLAKLNERQLAEAQQFKQEYLELCAVASGSRTGLTPRSP